MFKHAFCFLKKAKIVYTFYTSEQKMESFFPSRKMNIASKYELRDLHEIFAQGFPLKGALVFVTFEEKKTNLKTNFTKNRNLFIPQKGHQMYRKVLNKK